MIRDMKSDDWNSVKAIYEQGIDTGFSTFNQHVPSYEQWNTEHIKDCRFVYVKDNIIVGWIAARPISNRYCYRGVIEVSIYVDTTYRGGGIGTALLKKMCEASEQKGYWSLQSSIMSVNIASIALHKKCGFREIGYRERIARDRFGNWENLTLLERRNNIM